MSRYHNQVSTDELLVASQALLKFCVDHGYPVEGLKELGACVSALQKDDFYKASEHFHAIPFGGMGSFNDWYPVVISEHENNLYVQAVFDALTERVKRLFRGATGEMV